MIGPNCSRRDMSFSLIVEKMGMEGMFFKIAEIMHSLITSHMIVFPSDVAEQIRDLILKLTEAHRASCFEERNQYAVQIGQIIHENTQDIGGFISVSLLSACIDLKCAPEDLDKVMMQKIAEQLLKLRGLMDL